MNVSAVSKNGIFIQSHLHACEIVGVIDAGVKVTGSFYADEVQFQAKDVVNS